MKKTTLISIFLLLIYFLISGFAVFDNFNQTNVTLDEVKIGNQYWMTENLNVDKFRNGDQIFEAKTEEEWERAYREKMPAWCYYENDPANGVKYGKLYNWYAVNDPRGLAPLRWRIPSDEDFSELIDFLGGESVAGVKMKSATGWSEAITNETNSSAFSALPGGIRDIREEFKAGRFNIVGFDFSYLGKGGFWWSSSELTGFLAWRVAISAGEDDVNTSFMSGQKPKGMSVRCIRN